MPGTPFSIIEQIVIAFADVADVDQMSPPTRTRTRVEFDYAQALLNEIQAIIATMPLEQPAEGEEVNPNYGPQFLTDLQSVLFDASLRVHDIRVRRCDEQGGGGEQGQ